MELKDLRTKELKDLHTILAEQREKMRAAKFSVSNKQLKNVRELRNLKKLVARVLTVIKEKTTK